jgi:hypothetical protein
MIEIRLIKPLDYDHITVGAGTVLGASRDVAERLVNLGVAEYVGHRKAVLQPEETRNILGPSPDGAGCIASGSVELADDAEADQPRRRGRPPKVT